MEQCLWVLDTRVKIANGIGRGLEPEKVRCRKNGTVFCRPCQEAFFGK